MERDIKLVKREGKRLGVSFDNQEFQNDDLNDIFNDSVFKTAESEPAAKLRRTSKIAPRVGGMRVLSDAATLKKIKLINELK